MTTATIAPEVWYPTRDVLALLGGITPRDLRRLPIPRTPLKRGTAMFKGADLLAYLEGRGAAKGNARPTALKVIS